LNRLDRNAGIFSHVTVNDGLASDKIIGILEDSRESLWLLTPKGISRYTPATRSIRNYDARDGVRLDAALYTPYLKDGNGEMFFGGFSGLIRFNPDSIMDNLNVPSIVLTAFKKQEQQVKLDTAISEKKMIQLSYKDNVFSFEFAALNFVSGGKNQCAYRLEGFDEDWVYAGTKRTATYTNLDGGSYIFRVKGSNNDGIWNEKGTSIAVIVTPPFWKTWWFRVFGFVAILLSVGGSIRYVEMKKLKKRIELLENERALERERTRISQDMHDEVGSSLSEIAILSELAKKKPEESEAHIQEISDLASEVIDNVSEIVWAMNPRNDTLDNLVAHLRRYAVKYLNLAQIRCSFDAPENVPPHHLTAEVRRNIFLVVKEALHNIVKHAHAREVSVTVKLVDRSLEIQIGDNGKGFDLEELAESGNGLGNMNKRMADIGGVLTMTSRPDHGTRVAMRVPVISPQ
jgi:signal transduction histidine kinase